MSKKTQFIIECLIFVILLVFYTVKEVIPEWKKTHGSSESFIQTKRYQNLIEMKLSNQLDVGFVLNKEGKIYHLFFFDNPSTILYNKNIENQSLEDSIQKTISILKEKGSLKEGDSIQFIYYEEDSYEDFLKIWKKEKFVITEEKGNLQERAKSLGIEEESTSSILLNMDFYSKEFTRKIKKVEETASLDESTSKKFSNTIYLKIEKYVKEKDIIELEKDNTEFVLSLVPADANGKYYPTTNSWFYVREGKIYAFIEFQEQGNVYSYCYQGSIDLREKGECVS